jgi:hypothetical protein
MTKNSTFLSLSEAAEVTGKSKSVIHKALTKGKISYIEKNESGYKIDPSELFRVFPKNTTENTKTERSRTHENTTENGYKINELQAKLDAEVEQKLFYKEQFYKLEQERDDWKKQAQTLLLQSSVIKTESINTQQTDKALLWLLPLFSGLLVAIIMIGLFFTKGG